MKKNERTEAIVAMINERDELQVALAKLNELIAAHDALIAERDALREAILVALNAINNESGAYSILKHAIKQGNG